MRTTTRTLTAAILTASALTITGCQAADEAIDSTREAAKSAAVSAAKSAANSVITDATQDLEGMASDARDALPTMPDINISAAPEGETTPTGTGIDDLGLDPNAGTIRPLQEIDTPEERAALAREVLPDIPVLPATANGDATTKLPGYERGCSDGDGCVFGPSWTDDNTIPGTGHNGCDTRNDILSATLQDVQYKAGSDCVVTSGQYEEPYFGTRETFTKGEDHETQDEVDHVVALRTAWDTGAYAWPQEKRVNFANDTELNLLLTTRAANAGGHDVDGDGEYDRKDIGEYPGKSDMTGGDWLVWMSDEERMRDFAARYVLVAERYGLALTEEDVEAFEVALNG